MPGVGTHAFDNVLVYAGGAAIVNNKGGGGEKIALPNDVNEGALDGLAVADNLLSEKVLGFTGGGSTPPTGGRYVMGRATPKIRNKSTEFNPITLTIENDRRNVLSKSLMDAPRSTPIWVLEKATDDEGHSYWLHVGEIANVVKETPIGDTEAVSQMVITINPTQDVTPVDDSA